MITDLGVSALRGLTRLRRVSLAWNKCLTDDGLAALLLPEHAQRGGPAKRGVRELDLSCCVGLTDRACEVRTCRRLLAYLPRAEASLPPDTPDTNGPPTQNHHQILATQPLERLVLLGCSMLTDRGIGRLAFTTFPAPFSAPNDPTRTPPPHGGGLALFGAVTTTPAGGPLPQPPRTRGSLRSLVLAHCGLLTDEAVEGILALPALEELDMRDCTLLTGEGRSRLQKRLPAADVSCS